MTPDDIGFSEQAMSYLLGQLSEDAEAHFETRLLVEDRAEELSAIEDELIDRAVRDELRPEERAAFERHFRALPGREEKVRFARALHRAADGAPVVPIAAGATPRRRRTLRTAWFVMAAAAAAAAVLGLVALRGPRAPGDGKRAPDPGPTLAGGHDPAPPRDNPSPQPGPSLPTSRPVPPSDGTGPRATSPEPAPVMLAMALSSTRAAGSRELAIPSRAKRVILSIDLEGETSFANFRATLSGADDTAVWSADRVTADHTGSLVLRVPASALPSGIYRLAIRGVTAAGRMEELGTLSIQVAHRH